MTDASGAAATPPEELRLQIMDPRVPKNEREWWASREIEAQAASIAELTEARDFYAGRYAERCGQLATAADEERDRIVVWLKGRIPKMKWWADEACGDAASHELMIALTAIQRNEHRGASHD